MALYLSLFDDVVQILLPHLSKAERDDAVVAAWTFEIFSGLRGLAFYDPKDKKFLQPHVGGAFAIHSVLKKEGEIF